METLDPSFPTETKPWSSMNEYHLWALKKLSYVFSSVSYKQLNSGKATTHASGLEECRSYPKTWSKQYFGQSYQNNQSTRSTLSSAVTQAPSPHWTWCVCVVIIPRAAKLVHHSSYFWEGYHDSSTCASKRRWGKMRGRLCWQRGERGARSTCSLGSTAKRFSLFFQGCLLRFNCLLSLDLVWISSSSVC